MIKYKLVEEGEKGSFKSIVLNFSDIGQDISLNYNYSGLKQTSGQGNLIFISGFFNKILKSRQSKRFIHLWFQLVVQKITIYQFSYSCILIEMSTR